MRCGYRSQSIGLTILLCAASAHAAESALTLDGAVELALVKNERAGKATQRVETAYGGLDHARTAFLPTLVGVGTAAWSSIADKNGRSFRATRRSRSTSPW